MNLLALAQPQRVEPLFQNGYGSQKLGHQHAEIITEMTRPNAPQHRRRHWAVLVRDPYAGASRALARYSSLGGTIIGLSKFE
jgi:hypothetical protein